MPPVADSSPSFPLSRVVPLLRLLFDIALLRQGPQELPASLSLLGRILILALVAGTLGLSVNFLDVGDALVLALLDMGLASAFLWAGLWLVDHPGRFIQAATAWFGCGALIDLAGLPLSLMVDPSDPTSVAQQLGGIVSLAIFIWALVVCAHILRHTFEVRFAYGVAMAVSYFLLFNLLVMDLLKGGT